MTFTDITRLTEEFSAARTKLGSRVQALEDELAAVKKRHLPAIKKAVETAAEKQLELRHALGVAPELFVRPRTIIINGIKIGYEKGKGKIEIPKEEEARVVALIEKHFPDRADILIITSKKPAKKALAQLSGAELKKLGITVEDTGDHIIIKATDSEVDKLVDALLKEEKEIEEVAA